jgi:feruloyl esterase
MGAFHRNARALAAPGAQISNAKVARVAKAVREACDGLDGVADGVVSHPAACSAVFDPASLRCAGGADTGDTCLSDAQLGFVTAWTTDTVFAGNPGYRNARWNLTGNEDDSNAWPEWATGNGNYRASLQYAFSDTTVKSYLARDPTVESIDYVPYDQDPAAMLDLANLNDATAADLRAFNARGGKLILWHGGNDAALSVNSTAEYFDAVGTAVGGDAIADTFVRFYVAPGANHCSGGPGADSADLLGALDAWVTRGAAPATLAAQKVMTNGAVILSRPLCRHPAYPRYTGASNDPAAAALAANFTCTSPP